MNMKKCTPSRPMFVLRTYEDRNAITEISQNLTERLSNFQDGTQQQKSTLSRQTSTNSNASLPPPPPPLPFPESSSSKPTTNGTSCNTLKSNRTQKPRAPPVPEKRSTLSFNQPPPCPTPDYDTLSIASSTCTPKLNGQLRNGHGDNVEMESLESFVLYSPTGNKPRPPDIYFSNTTSANGSISSGTSTLRKQRPVSVTIGEYGNGTMRKPGKLNFLQNGKDEVDERRRQTITSQFATELAQTLNRSNLKRRTESMENLLNCPQIKPQNNGCVRISLSNMSKNIVKSTNDLTSSRENLSEVFANRVTININNSSEKRIDNKNGILKNSAVDNVPEHKQLVAQKSITFRELPIVINEKASQVTT